MSNKIIEYFSFLTSNQRQQAISFAKNLIQEGKDENEKYTILFHPDISSNAEDNIIGLIKSNDLVSSYTLKEISEIDINQFNTLHKQKVNKDKKAKKAHNKEIGRLHLAACKAILKAPTKEDVEVIKTNLRHQLSLL
jgi:hypothetical protein